MGAQQSSGVLGSKSTAKQVVDEFGQDQYLDGKVVIVTGGNSGIGLETCKALLSAGAKVILCSRSVDAANKAIDEEIKNYGHGNYIADSSKCIVKQLDLNSLTSVKAFADDFLKTEKNLDLLVLNAGIMALPTCEFTRDGFEKQIGVNHFGHAYLTSLLLPLLKNQKTDSRIVILTSTAHSMGSVIPTDLHFKNGRKYTPWGAYGQSKLANLLYAKSLADKLKGTNCTAVSVHPGVISTGLWKSSGWLVETLAGIFISDKTIPQGAATTVWGCLAPCIATEERYRGAYLDNCNIQTPSIQAQDLDGILREQLWIATENQLDEATKCNNK